MHVAVLEINYLFITSTGGSLFLFDRKVLRYFRKDGHNWRKKKDGKTVKEAHERLKAGPMEKKMKISKGEGIGCLKRSALTLFLSTIAKSLDKSISMLPMELAATRSSQEMRRSDKFTHISELTHEGLPRKKTFIVIGINTAFSSRKRRETSSIGTREGNYHPEHVEGYHELPAKTKIFFSTAVPKWDADFYVKVDDDVHVLCTPLFAGSCVLFCCSGMRACTCCCCCCNICSSNPYNCISLLGIGSPYMGHHFQGVTTW
ncbi:hypothetical protein CsSME_00007521 [Camellia sinensis var. sinensis]